MSNITHDPRAVATQGARMTQLWSDLFATALSQPTITPWPDRTVGPSMLGLQEIWRYHSEPSIGNALSAVVVDKRVILMTAGDAGESRSPYIAYSEWVYLPMLLTALKIENGQLLWRTPLAGASSVDSATQDSERLYLVSGWRVHAIDVNTGEQLWETKEFSGHTGYYFRPWDSTNPLHLYATTPKMILIDPLTGAVLGEEPAGEILTYDDTEFATNIGRLEARDRASGAILWQRDDDDPLPPQAHMVLWPSFIKPDVIFRTGVLTFSLSRTQIRNGVNQWETEQVYLSNFALSDGRLYILREDNALVTLDANSGEVLDEIAISGPKPDLQRNYWVAAQPPYVLAYFGNTSELIAFKMP